MNAGLGDLVVKTHDPISNCLHMVPACEGLSMPVLSNLFGLAGHKVEHRRCKDRGAKGSEGGWSVESGCPPPHWGEVRPRKFFYF